MIGAIWIFAVLLGSLPNPTTQYWRDIELLGLDSVNGSETLPVANYLRLKRIGRGTFGISGSAIITDTFENYTFEYYTLHSKRRDNSWKVSPIRYLRGPLCSKVNNEFRNFVMKDMRNISNLPYTEDKSLDLCQYAILGMNYTIQNYQFDYNIVPKFIETGRYNGHVIIRNNLDEVTAEWVLRSDFT